MKDNKNNNSDLFLLISILFVACVLISNILASKIISIFGISMTGGVLIFPISYIIGDILTEVYGFKKAKKVIIYGFICNFIMVLTFYIAIKLPYPDFWINQQAFETILGNTPRILIASFVGYILGGLTNSYILEYIKYKSKIRFLWFRTILSTIVGEGLDTLIFILIGFYGTMSNIDLMLMILYQSGAKILYEIVLTPLTYKAIKFIKNKESIVSK